LLLTELDIPASAGAEEWFGLVGHDGSLRFGR
jgi:hypothetical protein